MHAFTYFGLPKTLSFTLVLHMEEKKKKVQHLSIEMKVERMIKTLAICITYVTGTYYIAACQISRVMEPIKLN